MYILRIFAEYVSISPEQSIQISSFPQTDKLRLWTVIYLISAGIWKGRAMMIFYFDNELVHIRGGDKKMLMSFVKLILIMELGTTAYC